MWGCPQCISPFWGVGQAGQFPSGLGPMKQAFQPLLAPVKGHPREWSWGSLCVVMVGDRRMGCLWATRALRTPEQAHASHTGLQVSPGGWAVGSCT